MTAYLHRIEATQNAANPIWDAIVIADAPEDYDGTADAYGRDVLRNWVYDESAQAVDEDGRPLLRVTVWLADDEDMNSVAVVTGAALV